jgi:hypothetical protein
VSECAVIFSVIWADHYAVESASSQQGTWRTTRNGLRSARMVPRAYKSRTASVMKYERNANQRSHLTNLHCSQHCLNNALEITRSPLCGSGYTKTYASFFTCHGSTDGPASARLTPTLFSSNPNPLSEVFIFVRHPGFTTPIMRGCLYPS